MTVAYVGAKTSGSVALGVNINCGGSCNGRCLSFVAL